MTGRRRALVAAVVLCAAFGFVAILVIAEAGGDLDGRVSSWVVNHRLAPLTSFLRRFTDLGAWYLIGPIVAVASIWLWARGLRREAVYVAACTASSWGLNLIIKALVQRESPGTASAIEDPSKFAFPSGHTMTTTAFVTALAIVVCTAVIADHSDGSTAVLRRRRLIVALVAAGYAGLMGFSRVYLAVHWPGDVAGGWALGAAYALATWGLFVAPREGTDTRETAEVADGTADAPAEAIPVPAGDPPRIRIVLFDWGNTLMVDDGQLGPMVEWPRVAAMPGAAEALAALHGRYRLYVATNADDSGAAEVMAALGRVGLARFVDRVFSSRDLGARKPDQAFYAAVLAALRADAAAHGEPPLRADQVAMVGDSYENDVAGAWAAGLRTVWFNPTGLARPSPATAWADAKVSEIRSLGELSASV
jgi:putative hydrolase of the HAD superfamily